MDRTAWIVVTLCVLGLVGWEIWITKQRLPQPAIAGATPSATASPSGSLGLVPAPSATPIPSPTPAIAEFAEKTETLRNSDIEVHLTNRGGGISDAILLHHDAENGSRVQLNSPQHLPIGAFVSAPQTPSLPEFTIARTGENAVEFSRTTPEGVAIRKAFSFPPTSEPKDNFLVAMEVEFRNEGMSGFQSPAYYVALGSAAPIHPRDYPLYTRLAWCINGKVKDRNVSSFEGSGGFLGLVGQRAPQSFFEEAVNGAEWVAVTNQFFTTLVVPTSDKADGVWARRFDVPGEQKVSGIEGLMRLPGFELPPGKTRTARFEIYAGPKIYHRLALLRHNEAEIMNFGFFKLVSQFLLNFMNSLHRILWNSYAAAILALTTIIRLVLWPLQSKANRSMRQTAMLGPKMQELKEKYKDDPQKMNAEVMKLYKQYGINPVGGCLPVFIQIPIFFGLYQMLGQAVELRNERFLWVRDLSQPDTVAHLPILGWPINILPLLMGATQVWLMQLTPKTADPTQRRVMMFMPLIFLFFCYNFAAALALYYTAQNLFSILQLYQNRKQPMPTLEKVAVPKRKRR